MVKIFKINDLITLKLEGKKSNIYVNNVLFLQCKYLLINIPTESVTSLEEIDSVDDAEVKLVKDLEDNGLKISPDLEF